jgi:hypothetical protein
MGHPLRYGTYVSDHPLKIVRRPVAIVEPHWPDPEPVMAVVG